MKKQFKEIVVRTLSKIGEKFDYQNIYYKQRGVLCWQDSFVSGEAYLVSKVLPSLNFGSNPTVVDVGANEGEFALAVKSALPSARIICVEPVLATFERLKNKVAQSHNIDVINAALGEENGSLEIYDYHDRNGSSHASLYANVLTELHKASEIRTDIVPVRKLDDIATGANLGDISLLKIDTEGHELAVLRGALALIRQQRLGMIQFEFNEMNVISRVFLKDFYDLLDGYFFYRLMRAGLLPLGAYTPKNEIFQFQNILAVRQDMEPQVAGHRVCLQ